MNKILLALLPVSTILAACVSQPVLDNTTVQDILAMNCKQLNRQNDYLRLKIAQLRVGEIPFASQQDIDRYLQEALERQKAVNEASVHNMCTFG